MDTATLTPNYRTLDGAPRTRRPMGHRVEPDGPDPETPVATFLYREDADGMAGHLRNDGYLTRVQYVGAWMRWAILAKRKSWTYERWMNTDGTLGDRW